MKTSRPTGEPWRRAEAGRPTIFAHRGLPRDCFENTIGAYQAALAAGAGGIELDVSMTRDGRLICFHDRDLVRISGTADPVRGKRFSEIRSLPLEGRERVPTLDEALDVIGPDVPVIIDVKPAGRADLAIVESLVALARRRRLDASGLITISAFNWLLLQILARRMPEVRLAVLAARETTITRLGLLGRMASAYSAIHPMRTIVAADSVERWHASGLCVGTWVVNEPDEARRVVEAGVDYLITDDPAQIASALGTG